MEVGGGTGTGLLQIHNAPVPVPKKSVMIYNASLTYHFVDVSVHISGVLRLEVSVWNS